MTRVIFYLRVLIWQNLGLADLDIYMCASVSLPTADTKEHGLSSQKTPEIGDGTNHHSQKVSEEVAR